MENTNIYDFIIVGAGCAGSVVAARLAENLNLKILLLEGGSDNTFAIGNNNINDYQKKLLAVPAQCVNLISRYNINPTIIGCLKNKGQIEASPSHLEFTIKERNRYFTYPRGNGAGGSTNHHNMIDGRGSHLPYERISKKMSDPKWSYQNISKYYNRMEKFHGDIPEIKESFHGRNGWLQVKYSSLENDFSKNFIEAAKNELNANFVGDLNIPGQYSGIGYNMAQVDSNGQRSYAYKDLILPLIKKQNNLTIKFNSLVSKILLKRYDEQLTAYGVEVLENPNLYELDTTGNKVNSEYEAILPDKNKFHTKMYYAKKEVILCGGVFNTPQILMLSGLGPKQHLKELGIHVEKDIPGIGSNMMDHHEFCIDFELDPKKFMWRWQAALLYPKINYVPEEIKPIIIKYMDYKGLTDNGCQLILDWHSGMNEINPDEPDLHFQILNTFFFDFNNNFLKIKGDNLNLHQNSEDNTLPNPNDPLNPYGIKNIKNKIFNSQYDPTNPRVFMSILIENMKINKANGTVRLHNKDPRKSPIIDFGFGKDDVTLERLARSILIARKIMNTSEMKKYSVDPTDYSKFEILPGPKAQTIPELMEYLRTWSCIGHHGAGTAKMGLSTDKMAVVDSDLCVYGVHGLRIIDASIYPAPDLHAYNPTRGIYMIAEMMSDVIKEKYQLIN
ncbi:glucose-methanol-choline oxidoreductase [Cotonvirus japonicus]|uniref:Glucose-methanol-choline oxidoreductase n=1 Tax=Cotonvirus japonicus TaxID=2811091 RepID=A0ABM7NTD3_9VIRU|nr:glucose-methanol-choline oxidoreductase [Cotonvirus japonicus]BCS83423.1 glucose-methanol-choline oxidoreductase [Cotonvirus japonicus]